MRALLRALARAAASPALPGCRPSSLDAVVAALASRTGGHPAESRAGGGIGGAAGAVQADCARPRAPERDIAASAWDRGGLASRAWPPYAAAARAFAAPARPGPRRPPPSPQRRPSPSPSPRKPPPPAGPRLNKDIRAATVRLVTATGHDVMPLAAALAAARDAGLDLVEIQPLAEPPVCRLMDYARVRAESRAKETDKDARKKTAAQRKAEIVKVVGLTPRIAPHDLAVKSAAISRFLEDKHRVKVTVLVKKSPEMVEAMDLLRSLYESKKDACKLEATPKSIIGVMFMILIPSSKDGGGDKDNKDKDSDAADDKDAAPRGARAAAPAAVASTPPLEPAARPGAATGP